MLPKRWLQERERDPYHRQAKKEGYRSRAAYKLLQAVKKYRFMKKGDVVVDLGAAPGGWMQAARNIVGERGYVLGVDIKEIIPLEQPNVKAIKANMTDPRVLGQIIKNLPRKPNVLLSDASPNISGVWNVDHARQIGLAETALEMATKSLHPNGNFFVKVFHGDLINSFVKKVKRHFKFVKIVKPKASRSKSSEIYVLAKSFIAE